jgi:hypothetical protein
MRGAPRKEPMALDRVAAKTPATTREPEPKRACRQRVSKELSIN